jgi:hypothetical protein
MRSPIRGGILAGTYLGLLATIGLVAHPAVAVQAGLLSAMFAALLGSAAGRPGSGLVRLVLRCAAAGALGAFAMVGLSVLVGVEGAIVLALAGAAVAGWWLWQRQWRWPGLPEAAAAAAELTGRNGLAALSNDQLGREWRRSHASLIRAGCLGEYSRIYALRRRQLDEMERRDPEGFDRWIFGGGWVTCDTAPFLDE